MSNSENKSFLKNYKTICILSIFCLIFLVCGLLIGLTIGEQTNQQNLSVIETEYKEQIEATKDEMKVALEEAEALHNSEMLIAKIEFDEHLVNDIEKEQFLNNYIAKLENDIEELESVRTGLEVELDEKHEQLASIEYPDATQVWMSLQSEGLSDVVCAGIMGNIMAEVGGQTLDISYWKKQSPSDSYYGICQWNRAGIERMLQGYGSNLRAQINFLIDELYRVFPNDHVFYTLEDEKEVALYFAKYFEKCGTGSYNVRQKNATKALEYFCGSQ